ncbi:MAG: DUF928 domain-containing protein [Cyanobacteria bacterium SBLK]|nr:DUF928 domain-containing protein [Cyanobacteria bacterium SBLK]
MRHTSHRFVRGILASLLLLGSITGNALPLFAQIESTIGFTPPEDKIGEPRNTGAGGSRGKCLKDPQDKPTLTVLAPQLPQSSEREILRGGLTQDDSPALFVYVPETVAKTADFLLLEQLEEGRSKELHYHEFSLPQQSGIVRFSLPVALEEGKTYEWHFALICDPDDRNGDAIAAGTIERISPVSLPTPDADPMAQIAHYGKAGLWYDFFALLTEERDKSPQLQAVWETALQGEFGQNTPIAQAPFLSCCSIVAREE